MSGERRARGLYWDRAWKLVEGCTKVSPGCDHCWSEAETVMRAGHPNRAIRERALSGLYLAQIPGDRSCFDGRVGVRWDNLELPLSVKRPTVWAVWNDLFHESVPEAFRNRAYNVMCRCRQHRFLLLTKRPGVMWDHLFRNGEQDTHEMIRDHIWHGVTVENQEAADKRMPLLLRVPGKRFVSIEPMLGAVDLEHIYEGGRTEYGSTWGSWESCLDGKRFDPWADGTSSGHPVVHAVLLGGESGAGARPMHPGWVRSIRDQCAAAGVPFYFKQWGEWLPQCNEPFQPRRYLFLNQDGRVDADGDQVVTGCGWSGMGLVGKRAAGRVLDGRTHDALPWEVTL